MNFTLNGTDYNIKFNFRTCRELKKIIKGLDPEDEQAMVDAVYDKGPQMVRAAIASNKLTPVPSIEKIEDHFDENEGFGADFFVASYQAIAAQVTPTRQDELEGAAKGN